MINAIEIKNFKGLEQLKIDELARINLIGGKNNVGKTSLLEALFLIQDRYNPQMFLRQYAWRRINAVPLAAESLWAPMFSRYDLGKNIEISLFNDTSHFN